MRDSKKSNRNRKNNGRLSDIENRIAEGQYYEAHQQLRVVASRYVKQENWSAAIDILCGGAQALLKAGQGGSGGDLCMYLVDVYNKAELNPDAGNKGMAASPEVGGATTDTRSSRQAFDAVAGLSARRAYEEAVRGADDSLVVHVWRIPEW